VLCFVVLIHELGHFIAARSFGISVKEFSVGVGPRLLGFTREGIEYSLRLLPLGGYVAFPPNYNGTEYYEQGMRYEEELDDFRRLKKDYDRYEKELVERKEEIRERGNNMSFWSRFFRSGDTATPVMKKPVKPEKPKIEYDEDPDLLQNRSVSQRAIVLVGGIVFNFILAFGLYFGSLSTTEGMPRMQIQPGVAVANTFSDAPAYNRIFRGDVITKINNLELSTPTNSISMARAEKYVKSVVSTIQATAPGEDVVLSIRRGGDSTETTIVHIVPTSVNDRPPSIGVSLSPNMGTIERVRAPSTIVGLREAAVEVEHVTSETAATFLELIGSLLVSRDTPKGTNAGPSLSGPVGIVRTGAGAIRTGSIATLASFAAAISINLAVVNALPLPGLDGGQLMFVVAEALRGGRKVDQRLQEEINGVALALLLVISLSTVFGDVTAMFR